MPPQEEQRLAQKQTAAVTALMSTHLHPHLIAQMHRTHKCARPPGTWMIQLAR